MKCPALGCPYRNENGFCKITACTRLDLIGKYDNFYMWPNKVDPTTYIVTDDHSATKK